MSSIGLLSHGQHCFFAQQTLTTQLHTPVTLRSVPEDNDDDEAHVQHGFSGPNLGLPLGQVRAFPLFMISFSMPPSICFSWQLTLAIDGALVMQGRTSLTCTRLRCLAPEGLEGC